MILLRRLALPAALGASLALAAPLAAQDTLIAPRAKGATSAPVTVYEMGDFQCPVCRRFFTETWPTIDKDYVATGKVRWVYIAFPLTSIHPNAEAAAEFAMCAAKQGKFWPTHDLLYQKQDLWAPLKDPVPFFLAQVDNLGLKKEALQGCLQSGAGRAAVESDAAGGARAGAHSTPTFYIEGGLMAGAYPIDIFRQVLDSIYKVKTAKH